MTEVNAMIDKPNLIGLQRSGLEQFFVDIGEKPFRARQVMQWIYQRGVTDFDAMTDLSQALRARLPLVAQIALPKAVSEHVSSDGTVKWLFGSGAGQIVEAVFIPEPGRGTL